ncbi:MAG: hypothetical protein HG424_003060 [candidate division SR1 bacterium]|nr:hypothetical protein [candidate division SR1 bacterium]
MEKHENRFIKNLGLVITVTLQIIAIVTIFNKMDARLTDLESWRKEVQDTRYTTKDAMIMDERVKNISANVTDMRADIKDIKKELKI